jgi:hypothetical protein
MMEKTEMARWTNGPEDLAERKARDELRERVKHNIAYQLDHSLITYEEASRLAQKAGLPMFIWNRSFSTDEEFRRKLDPENQESTARGDLMTEEELLKGLEGLYPVGWPSAGEKNWAELIGGFSMKSALKVGRFAILLGIEDDGVVMADSIRELPKKADDVGSGDLKQVVRKLGFGEVIEILPYCDTAVKPTA